MIYPFNMAIKRWKEDVIFSNYIRERDGWTCQRCFTRYNKHMPTSRMGLHCSHFHGRGKYTTRFDPDNATSLCYGCHRYMGSQPIEHMEFQMKRLGQSKFEELTMRANKTGKKRDYIGNKHFRNELELMLEGVLNEDT